MSESKDTQPSRGLTRALHIWGRRLHKHAKAIGGAEKKMARRAGRGRAAVQKVKDVHAVVVLAVAEQLAAQQGFDQSRPHEDVRERELGHWFYGIGVLIIGAALFIVDRLAFLSFHWSFWETNAFAALIAIADIFASHWVGEEARKITDAAVPAYNVGRFLQGRMLAGLIVGVASVILVGATRGRDGDLLSAVLMATISLSLFLTLVAMAYAHAYPALRRLEKARAALKRAQERLGVAIRRFHVALGKAFASEESWRDTASNAVGDYDKLVLAARLADQNLGLDIINGYEPSEVTRWRRIADGTQPGAWPDADHDVRVVAEIDQQREAEAQSVSSGARGLPPAA